MLFAEHPGFRFDEVLHHVLPELGAHGRERFREIFRGYGFVVVEFDVWTVEGYRRRIVVTKEVDTIREIFVALPGFEAACMDKEWWNHNDNSSRMVTYLRSKTVFPPNSIKEVPETFV